jgi:tight adherence protein B
VSGLTVVVLAMMLILGGGLAVMSVAGQGSQRMARRARRLTGGERGRKPLVAETPDMRRDRQGGLDALIHQLVPRPEALRARLAATGVGISIGRYGLICLGLAVVIPTPLILNGVSWPLALLVGLLGGLWLPHFVVGSLIKGRCKKFTKLFPDAIGLMVRGLKAGLPVTETMIVVGREIIGPVGEEFRRVSDQVRLGQPVEDALWQTAKRIESAEFNFLVITLSVQRETGGNLAETLENLEDILRRRAQMRLKIKAMSSEAVASAGIIGSLPFIMAALMFLVSRDYILTLFSAPLGWMMLAGGGTSLAIGILVMVKMVSFEV